MPKQFVAGLLLGSLLTILGGLLVGPNITLADVGHNNEGGTGQPTGRYQLRVDEKNGVNEYVVFDSENGVASVMSGDGSRKTVTADGSEPMR